MIDTQGEAHYMWKDIEAIYHGDSIDGDKYASSKLIGQYICEEFNLNPDLKNEVYELTLEWVNGIRTEQMTDQRPLSSLKPGNEMQADSCVIAVSLDEVYETAVGDSILRDKFYFNDHEDPEYDSLPNSDGITWYAEWIHKENAKDWGYEQLPWFAFILAKGFDYGAYPELSVKNP